MTPKDDKDRTATTIVTDVRPRPDAQIFPSHAGQMQLEIVGGPMDGERCRVSKESFSIGRGEVNDLPLSLVLSWYEQKAVAILLTLFSLGIRDIRLGPSLPAFITPNVLDVLVKNFHIKPITTPEEDLAAILGAQSAA